MKKNTITYLLLLFTLLPVAGFSQSKKLEDYKKTLLGTWKFDHLYSLKSDVNEETDDCVKAMTYTFNEDGTLSFENTDKSVCQYGNEKKYWSIIKIHDLRGKEKYAVRITEERMSERPSYDGNTFNDEIYMLVSFKKAFFTWIPKPQYSQPSADDIQYFYKKIS